MYATGLSSHLPKKKDHFGTSSTDYLIQKEGNDKTSKFLRYEGKVLRFQCVELQAATNSKVSNTLHQSFDFDHIDLNTIQLTNKLKRYAISYFLSDSSVDIRCIKKQGVISSGAATNLEENMLIMKKSKITKNWKEVQRGALPIFYEPMDFIIGRLYLFHLFILKYSLNSNINININFIHFEDE